MASERYKLSDCENAFCNCKELGSLSAGFCTSTSAEGYRNVESIAERLRKLSKVKARPGFDQRMAAAFAMELERETQERNRNWLKKNSQISLPDISADLIKNLF